MLFRSDGANALIDLGADNDVLSLTNGSHSTVKAASGDNTIVAQGDELNVTTGDGKDTVSIDGYFASVTAGEGDNAISINNAHNSSVTAGNGDNVVSLTDAEVSNVNLGDGDNTVTATSIHSSTVVAGDGDNTISLTAAHDSSIKTGSGDDVLNIEGERLTVAAGGGDNHITVDAHGHDETVTAGAGSDFISVGGNSERAIISSGNGDDSITVDGHDASIVSGTGDDKISIDGDNATITAGNGNKVIHADDTNNDVVTVGDGNNAITVGSYASVNAGKGNDTVSVGAQSSVSVAGGNNSIVAAGKDETIVAGDGKDDISVKGERAAISLGAGNDSVYAYGRYASVTSGTGRDTISVVGDDAVITTGAGDKFVSVDGKDAIITTDAGKDTIYAGASANISAGAGADYIHTGADATITAGEGKDTVSVDATGEVFTDYAFNVDHVVLKGGDDLTAANLGTDGKVSVAGADVTLNQMADGYYAAQVYDTDGKHKNYAWTSEEAATINGAKYDVKEGFYITGEKNTSTGDLMIGTNYADTVIAGENDSIVGGKGSDVVSVNSQNGVYVGLFSGDGTESVYGAKVGAEYDDDDTTFYLGDTNGLSAKFNGTELDLGLTNAKLAVADVASVSGANTTAKVKTEVNGTTLNTMVFSGTATLDEDTKVVYGADGAKGTTLVVNSTSGSQDAIDLTNSKYFASGDEHLYANVSVVDASTYATDLMLIGSTDTATTLEAGTAATSLWGGSAKGDLLVAGSGEDTFFYGSGDGRDTVSGYDSDKDKLYFLTPDKLKSVSRDGSGLTVSFNSDTTAASQKLTVASTTASESVKADTEYKLTTNGKDEYTAKVGYTDSVNAFTYSDDVNFFLGGNQADTLDVATSDNVVINLG